MRTRFTLTVLLILIVSLPLLLSFKEPQSKEQWKLVWYDDFNGNQLDTTKWNVLMRETSKHKELQYYIPEEVFVENGVLRIRSTKRKYGSQDYTSGRLDTRARY